MAANWSRKLARVVRVRGGKVRGGKVALATLSEARAYILDLPQDKQGRNSWQRAAGLLLAAAEDASRIREATRAIERALFLEMKWLPEADC